MLDVVRHVFFVLYTVMAVWLVAAAVLRTVLLLAAGSSLDALVFVTVGLGVIGLLVLVPTVVRSRRGRRNGRDGERAGLSAARTQQSRR